jgi:hypothetical protein
MSRDAGHGPRTGGAEVGCRASLDFRLTDGESRMENQVKDGVKRPSTAPLWVQRSGARTVSSSATGAAASHRSRGLGLRCFQHHSRPGCVERYQVMDGVESLMRHPVVSATHEWCPGAARRPATAALGGVLSSPTMNGAQAVPAGLPRPRSVECFHHHSRPGSGERYQVMDGVESPMRHPVVSATMNGAQALPVGVPRPRSVECFHHHPRPGSSERYQVMDGVESPMRHPVVSATMNCAQALPAGVPRPRSVECFHHHPRPGSGERYQVMDGVESQMRHPVVSATMNCAQAVSAGLPRPRSVVCFHHHPRPGSGGRGWR